MALEYWVDADDRLVEVDEEFRAFAVANGAPELATDHILGRRLDSFCSDDATTEIWSRLLARVRDGARIRVQVRCDAPDRRRLLDLVLTRDEGRRIRVVSTTLWKEPRSPIALLEATRQHGDTVLTCCSWCNKWRLPRGAWVEAEELVATLRLFEQSILPRVTHGICEACGTSLRMSDGA